MDEEAKREAQLADERRARKAARMAEKLGRMKVNDVVLQVQDGVINLQDVFDHIELKVKEGLKDGRK